jgi:hypothetical protein
MGKRARLLVLLVAAAAAFTATASSADAVTWHNTGDTAFTATSGASTRTVTGLNLNCNTALLNASASSSPSVLGWMILGSMVFGGCSGGGISSSVSCSGTFTPSSQSGSVSSGTSDLRCSVIQFGAEVCILEGQVVSSYTNPVSPSTFGKLAFPHNNTLRTTNGAAGTCFFTANHIVTSTAQVFTITSATGGPSPHLGPVYTRTP